MFLKPVMSSCVLRRVSPLKALLQSFQPIVTVARFVKSSVTTIPLIGNRWFGVSDKCSLRSPPCNPEITTFTFTLRFTVLTRAGSIPGTGFDFCSAMAGEHSTTTGGRMSPRSRAHHPAPARHRPSSEPNSDTSLRLASAIHSMTATITSSAVSDHVIVLPLFRYAHGRPGTATKNAKQRLPVLHQTGYPPSDACCLETRATKSLIAFSASAIAQRTLYPPRRSRFGSLSSTFASL